jgi:uncharacterized membrane protein
MAKPALAAAVAAAIALAGASAAHAQFRGVKCYGITKAGQNDCAHARGIHLCSGEALVDYDGGDWKLVKNAAACAAKSGSLTPYDGANPKPPKS